MSTMEAPSLEVLERTQDLLQRSHDFIEMNGFWIQDYAVELAEIAESEFDYYGMRPGATEGPRCYIGTVRTCAGIDPSPNDVRIASAGDGPELVEALSLLDMAILDDLDGVRIQKIELEYTAEGRIGRYVEAYGFQTDTNGDGGLGRDEALGVFRKALTEVAKQIESVQHG